MKLCLNDIQTNDQWEQKGYKLPEFDIEKVTKNTIKNPTWIHFGAGNIFRAFIATLSQHLLNQGKVDTGIIVCEAFDEEIIEKAYRNYDNLSLAVTLKGTGDIEKEVLASVVESVMPKTEYARMCEIFAADSLQIASFTITEKGYAIKDSAGKLFPWISNDFDVFDGPSSTIGILTKLLFERYKAGKKPLAIVSMDNCSHNGTLLKNAVTAFAEAWVEKGYCESGFLNYIKDENLLSFNWSMIDKITPRPSQAVIELLEKDGLEGAKLVQTAKNTFVSCFVNAEQSEYLAIEDNFPNGRPSLEDVGVLFSDKETIDKIEKMKVCTCLNPLHTVLAVYGCLLGYKSISDEMKDPSLKAFIEKVGYVEGMPVVVDPKIINAKDFIKETIEVRFPNPFVPDTPQRIATDTSKKISVRYGETMKAYIAEGKTDLSFLTFIPLQLAGWVRYLMGVDDNNVPFDLSPDPNIEELKTYVKGISIGDGSEVIEQIKPLLANAEYFGINLYAYNLGEKVEGMFLELIKDKGAVKRTIDAYLAQ